MPPRLSQQQVQQRFPGGFATVVFDCDSTLSAIEGIDELAAQHRAEVSALTDAAMRGQLPLEDVYAKRLEIIRPTSENIRALGRLYVERALPDAQQVCTSMAAAGVDLRIVSGGLLPAVMQLARYLGIPDSNVAAVDIYFDAAGHYTGFDRRSELARSGGKLTLLRRWLPDMARPVMLVGDGSTDLEAQPVVDLFVAFAGFAARANVMAAADFVVETPSLAPIAAIATPGNR